MKTFFLSQDLWMVVANDFSSIPDNLSRFSKKEKDTLYKNVRKNHLALFYLQQSVEKTLFPKIADSTSAKKAWDILEQEFQERDSLQVETAAFPTPIMTENDSDKKTWRRDKKIELLNAIVNGDLRVVKKFIKTHGDGMKDTLLFGGQTALQAAALAGQSKVVEVLLKVMTKEDTQLTDIYGQTTLEIAIINGMTDIVKCLVDKYPDFTSVRSSKNFIPVVIASRFRHEDTMRYLLSKTKLQVLEEEDGWPGFGLLCQLIDMKLLDLVLYLLRLRPSLMICKGRLYALIILANTKSVFVTARDLPFLQRWVYKCLIVKVPPSTLPARDTGSRASSQDCYIDIDKGMMSSTNPSSQQWGVGSMLLKFFGIKKIYDQKLNRSYACEILRLMCDYISKLEEGEFEGDDLNDAIFSAIKEGITDCLVEILKNNSDELTPRDSEEKTALYVAVEYRQAKIANYVFNRSGKEILILRDVSHNNLLHAAAKPNHLQLAKISGSALQMQSEIQWYKEVQSLVPSYLNHKENKDGKTPYQLFTGEHQDLLKNAEAWMKATATSYTVVGALIITIMFPAAFTFPGGNNQDGFPTFIKKAPIMVYVVSDAISLFSASTSVLMFLGILTSRYNYDDFHKSLPSKLVAGLSSLFLSIAAMMATFCSALFLTLEGRWLVGAYSDHVFCDHPGFLVYEVAVSHSC